MYSISARTKQHLKFQKTHFQFLKLSIENSLFVLLFFGLSFLTFGQESSLSGMVVEEESSKTVANAIVTIKQTPFTENTSEEGKFNFNGDLPKGEHMVEVSKDGYEDKYFLVHIMPGKKLIVEEVKLTMTKKEKKKRKKEEKELKKKKKELKKDDRKLFGLVKKKNQEPEVAVTYEEISNNETNEEHVAVEPQITPLQQNYAKVLGVAPEEITNTALFSFIDEWMGTPYLLGGETKAGIDCSSFSQLLFFKVYGWPIERTAQKQMDSKATITFSDAKYLEEGDLVFFRAAGDYGDTITHVGLYLANNKFINATSRVGKSGSSGVKISDLSDPFWNKRFYAGGRRVNTNG